MIIQFNSSILLFEHGHVESFSIDNFFFILPFHFDKDQLMQHYWTNKSIFNNSKSQSTTPFTVHIMKATWQNGKAIISTVNLSLSFNMAACQSFFQCLLKSICIFMYIWMSCSSLSIVSVLLFKIPHTHWMLRTGQSLWLMQELLGTYGECIAELNWESTGVNNTLCQIIFDSFKDKIYRPIDQ